MTTPSGLVGFAADLSLHGTRTALAAPCGAVSYDDLATRVAQARRDLDDLRVGGDRHLVHLRAATTVDFVVSWLAALAGNHPVLLSSSAGVAAAYGATAERVGGRWRATGAPAPVLHPDLRLLMSTSGSTGSPKLVRLSGSNLDSNAAAIADYLRLSADDVAITTLPFDYCYGLSVLHSHLLVGATVVLDQRSVTDAGLWHRAREVGATSFAGVPYTFDLLAAAGWPELPTLRQVTQAGGRLAPERVLALAEQGQAQGWDLFVMYGQTEATARMAWLPPELAATHPGAVGRAVPGGSFRLAEVDGAPPGAGELVYSGPNVMMGYAESPADLARGAELDELHTGDLAVIDDSGLVSIVGRRARFAKLFGHRVDLDRVQTLLHLGGHEVVCAQADDGEELVIATCASPDPLALAEIVRAAAGATSLPEHAIRVVPLDELPRLPSGKPDYRTVATLKAAAQGDDVAPADSVARLFERVLGARTVTRDSSFLDLGGDSLSYVELSLRLEEHLGPLPAHWPRLTVAELAARLDRPRARSRRWARVETSIVLRALAILAIVGSHTDLWTIVGGAHVLLAVAGANFARFQLVDETATRRLHRVLRACARIAVPAIAWIGLVSLATGAYPWRTVLLLNDLLGGSRWSEPAWHFWFIEVVLLLVLLAGTLSAIPAVARLERRHRFGVAASLTALGLVPRLVAELASYDGDVIHSSAFVAWIFAAGWAACVAQSHRERAVVTVLALAGAIGLTDDPLRDALIAGGVVALIWLRDVPWPRALVAPAGVLASASLYIYLTHWQVYPHFEDRWPLAGLVASLVVGVAAWRLVLAVSPSMSPGSSPGVSPGSSPGVPTHRQES